MKKVLILMLLLTFYRGECQFSDDFSDGEILENPCWAGDTGAFIVTDQQQLRLQTTGPDTSMIVTQSSVVLNSQWDLWLKMSFNTSANNYARIYLVSDNPVLSGSLNGYFLQIGGPDDSVTLQKQTGLTISTLMTGCRSFTGNSTNILMIRIVHDEQGVWHLLTDPSGGNNLVEEGSCPDNSIAQCNWFGIFCRFTSSNSTKFYFDDIRCGPIITDTTGPSVLSLKMKNDNNLEVVFSEPVDPVSATDLLNYSIMNHEGPIEANTVDGNPERVLLSFTSITGENFSDTLLIRGVKDISENEMQEEKRRFFRHEAGPYDLIINEIMADPDPPMGLPISEYLEIFNRDSLPVDLEGWSIGYGSNRKYFPSLIIDQESYLLVSNGNFPGIFGPVAGIFTSSSSLSNEGTVVTLYNPEGKIIHSVEYSIDWHSDDIKHEGGWSLEMIDPANPCGCKENWESSSDPPGGTPGRQNSAARQNADTVRPYIKGIRIHADTAISVIFSETIDSISLTGTGNWFLQDEAVPVVSLIRPSFSEIRLFPAEKLAGGISYELSVEGEIKDCSGNLLKGDNHFLIGLPDTASVNDIVINEILSDPYPDASRFIEIYNTSSHILDLHDIVISVYDTLSLSLEDPEEISAESRLFFPGQYLVLTDNPEGIRSFYHCPGDDAFAVTESLPSMTNDYGSIAVSRKNDGLIIDRMQYFPAMQFPLLNDPEGVSLERVSFSAPSNSAGNWHSASASCGYATPGYQNSQFSVIGGSSKINIDPVIFSPDNDGTDDQLAIKIAGATASLVNIVIFDNEGKPVKKLVNNYLTGSSEYFFWDGTDDERQKAPVGIYVVYIEITEDNGNITSEKKAVVVAARF